MDVSVVKREIESWPPEQQDDLARHLGVLRGRRRRDHTAELKRRLEDADPAHWLTVEELRDKLEAGDA